MIDAGEREREQGERDVQREINIRLCCDRGSTGMLISCYLDHDGLSL